MPPGRPANPNARNERRQQILLAAHRCFVRKGFHASTTAEVSKEAGISVAGLYQYFPCKDDLILELVQWDLAHSLKYLAQLFDGDDVLDSAERLLHTLFSSPDAEDAARLRLEIMAEAGRSEAIRSQFQISDQAFKRALGLAIQRSQQVGQIDPSLDVELLTLAVLTLCDGMFSRLLLPVEVRGPVIDAGMMMLRRALGHR